jgi:hypothetical protein
MCATAANLKVVNVTTLESQLDRVERKFFDAAAHEKLKSARSTIFGEIQASGYSRLNLGMAVRAYHECYKEQGRRPGAIMPARSS